MVEMRSEVKLTRKHLRSIFDQRLSEYNGLDIGDNNNGNSYCKTHTKRSRCVLEEGAVKNVAHCDMNKVNLGQYVESKAFGDNSKKRERFARLMGGAKHTDLHDKIEAAHHATLAASASTINNINKHLEEQFDAARMHKKSKGLGA
uniref:Ribosomal RNA large subunit methyltransferase L n=1 Tax=Lygus hesperus TaxID=30085 RepID=A0A0A9VTX4_LYGHE